jgi:drug/metabolite transporter (DMT)-like permease
MAGASFGIIKYLVGYITPVELLFLRFMPAAIVAAILLLTVFRISAARIIKKWWWFFLAREMVAILGFHLCLNIGESVLPAGVSALIVATWPIITIILAWKLIGEKITKKKIFGGILAFLGAAVVIIYGAREEADLLNIAPADWIRYSLLLLISPLSAATVTAVSKWFLSSDKTSDNHHSFLFTMMCRAPGGIYVLVVYLLFQDSIPLVAKMAEFTPLIWALISIISLYNTLLGFWLFNWSLQKLEAGNVASVTYLSTVFALIIAWLFLDERLGTVKIIGGALIVAGVLLANVGRYRRGPAVEPSPIEA